MTAVTASGGAEPEAMMDAYEIEVFDDGEDEHRDNNDDKGPGVLAMIFSLTNDKMLKQEHVANQVMDAFTTSKETSPDLDSCKIHYIVGKSQTKNYVEPRAKKAVYQQSLKQNSPRKRKFNEVDAAPSTNDIPRWV